MKRKFSPAPLVTQCLSLIHFEMMTKDHIRYENQNYHGSAVIDTYTDTARIIHDTTIRIKMLQHTEFYELNAKECYLYPSLHDRNWSWKIL